MHLIADRFVVEESCSTFARDLATAQPVWLEIRPAGAATEQREWTLRCDELFQLRHPSMAALVDYGFVGPAQRFEAWRCRAPWKGDATAAQRASTHAARFLESVGLPGVYLSGNMFDAHYGPIVVPSFDGGGRFCKPSSMLVSDGDPGVALIARPSVAALSEMFHLVDEQRPRAVAVWGPPGSGLSTLVLLLARDARASGFVPIDACLFGKYGGEAITGRSLFVIDRGQNDDAIRAFLRAALRSPRPHVCLVVGREEVPGLDGFTIGSLDPELLIRAVRPLNASTMRLARRAAEKAAGLPGRFVHALFAETVRTYETSVRPHSRVAEQAATYSSGATAVVDAIGPDPGHARAEPWGTAGEITALREKLRQAGGLLESGRHAPGLRLLRQAVTALARRSAWADSARGGLTLASELLTRARPRDALRAVDDLQEHAERAGEVALLHDAAIVAGHAWVDLARLDEAERVLRAGLTTVGTRSDRQRAQHLTTSLARCAFWRGEFAEARSLLEQGPWDGASDEDHFRRQRLLARLAAAEGDSQEALGRLEEACRLARSMDSRSAEAGLHYTAALTRLVIGDLAGVDRDVRACVPAARAARRPMRVVSALLIQAEADRRRHLSIAADRRRMLERVIRTATPLIRLRWELLLALSAARDEQAAAADFVSRCAVKGVAVLARHGLPPANRSDLDPIVREIIGILHVCHDADDELVVLRQVCVRVRQQLHAAAVAFVAVDAIRRDSLVGDGPRIEPDVAQRAMASGVVISPHRIGDRLEAAAPVVYGGAPIAALCARWTPGALDDLSRAPSVLSMAATAAAPVVNALLNHRSKSPPSSSFELIGATPAISELRRAVERAAAAPFPVLIVGESGSGKELVARGVHRCGSRRDRPFCTLNCAALPDDLVESELFGHARGSFTGAMADRPGVFEEAHGGTLLLDEIGELSLRAQAKLLRVIQEGELRRIGENISRRIDVRIVSATNRDLRCEAEAGRFRFDLLYRLDVIRIAVPALRERREDLPALVDHFWNDATRRVGSRATLSAAARAALGSYDWPGNVRELQNVLAALAVRCPKRGVVPPSALPAHVVSARRPDVWRLDAARRTFEEGFVRAALVRAGGHRTRAASELGLTRQGLNKLMSRLGIE